VFPYRHTTVCLSFCWIQKYPLFRDSCRDIQKTQHTPNGRSGRAPLACCSVPRLRPAAEEESSVRSECWSPCYRKISGLEGKHGHSSWSTLGQPSWRGLATDSVRKVEEKQKCLLRDTVHIKAKQEALQFASMRQKDKALLAGDRRGKGRQTKGERRSTAECGCSAQPERQSMLPLQTSSMTTEKYLFRITEHHPSMDTVPPLYSQDI